MTYRKKYTRRNTESFKQELMDIFDKKYGLDLIEYKNTITKVKIICPIHNIIEMQPSSLLKGQGCKYCANLNHRLSAEKFFDKVEKRHPGKFNMSIANYQGYHKNILIKCIVHEIIIEVKAGHLLNHNYNITCSECNRLKKEKLFLQKAKEVLIGYDLSKVYYINNRIKVLVKCPNPNHPEYSMSPVSIVNGRGCLLCGRERTIKASTITQEEFISRIKIKYGEYYDLTETRYINSSTKVLIGCPNKNHGGFLVTPTDFLSKRGSGCPKCVNYISKIESKYLDLLNLPNNIEHRQVKINIGSSYIKVDGFDPHTKTVYEFLGDFWHGNPQIYSNCLHKQILSNWTPLQLWCKTIDRFEALKKAGYGVIYIWESFFKDINIFLENNPFHKQDIGKLLKQNDYYPVGRMIYGTPNFDINNCVVREKLNA